MKNKMTKQTQKKEPFRSTGSSNLKVYMGWPLIIGIVLIIMTISAFFINWKTGAYCTIFTALLLIFIGILYVVYCKRIRSDLISYGTGFMVVQSDLLKRLQVPYAISDEHGHLLWMNQKFADITGLTSCSHKSISTVFTGIDANYPESNALKEYHVVYRGRNYLVTIKGVAAQELVEQIIGESIQDKRPQMLAVYLDDETETIHYRRQVEEDKLIIAQIYIDNYDECMDSIEDVRRSLLTALVERQVNKYVGEFDGIIQKIEKDKFFAIFKNRSLKELQEDEFSILENVKKISIGNTIPVTISIGIGMGGDSYARNYMYCRAAIDMALGRGGDQVVLKEGDNINFFGGKAQNQGKNTRVRARVKAHALRELILASDQVLIMGHNISDADCIGAASGLYRAAKVSQKPAHVVINDFSSSIQPLADHFKNNSEYPEDFFINSDVALGLITDDTLLIVVDNNRPSYTECPELLNIARHVVVFDHHLQSKEKIENAVLSYVEPYASSACEMVAEILQYYSDDLKLRPTEAEALYAGMMIDTNNFLNKTGVRTFEAAAYLRRNGADITRVRKMFRDDLKDYQAKAAAVQSARVYKNHFAIGVCPGECSSPTVIGAQAANELLDIRNIKASFVLTDYSGKIYISARSIDEVNVQIIMERLGGGGHLCIAGAQLKGATIEEATEKIKEAIDVLSKDNLV